MLKVDITYADGRQIEFITENVFYKTEFGWLKEIGYFPEGKNRKKWFPVGGKRDNNNDWTGTKLVITEIK